MADHDESRLSTLNRERMQIIGKAGEQRDRTFCVSCGAQTGSVSRWAESFVMSCNQCTGYGSIEPPPLPEAPASVPRCKMCGAAGPTNCELPKGVHYLCDPCVIKCGNKPPQGFAVVPDDVILNPDRG